jgi:intracellular sulfur oxidation DsrE/DsrF family protein
MTSTRRKLLLTLGLSFTLAFATSASYTQSAPGKVHHILFALTSGDEADWHLTTGNIRNLLSGLAPDEVEVEVVAFGPGIASVIKPSAADAEIQALMAKHVVFVACENSMRARKVTKADLIDGMGTVPSGIVEVVKKQEAGWTYVKAGR